MKKIEDIISPLVKSQFPAFYEEEGPRFVDFVRQYYTWMESQNQTLNASRTLFDLRDIDSTSSDFLKYFKGKYLTGIPVDAQSDVGFLTKHASDFYKSKGTEQGIQLLIQGMFKEDAEVYLPGEDLLKASDGRWTRPVYLELTMSPRTKQFVGYDLIGSVSGATAIMESYVRRRIGSKYVDVAYLSNVVGNFQTGEFITTTANTNIDDAPTVQGSLTNLTVVSGGADFAVGDIFTVTSSAGKQGQARVTAVSNETGRVKFIYVDALTSGGWGYSIAHSNVMVSEKVLTVTDRNNTNPFANNFFILEQASQQFANLSYTTARPNNANFEVGANVVNYYSNGAVGARAKIAAVGSTNATNGFLVLAPVSGNIAAVDTVFSIETSGTNAAFNANTGVNGTSDVITTTAAHTFVNNDVVVYEIRTGNTALSGLSVGAAYYVVNASGSNLQLSNTANGTPVNITASGTVENGHILVPSKGSGVVSSYVDRTATGIVVGANSDYVGLVNISSNGFIATPYSNIVGYDSNTTATVNAVSTGSGATFSIGALTDTESVFLSPDFIHANNTANVKFVTDKTTSINLNGNNSGLVSGGFGFIKFPDGDINSVLFDVLRFDSTTIGSIASLTSQNPGTDYNQDPFVLVNDPWVGGYGARDYVMNITGATKLFVTGEQIQQSYTKPATSLTVTGFTGTAANGDTMSTALVGEAVYQSNSTTNVAALGFVVEVGISGGAGSIKLRDVTGTFVQTSNSTFLVKTITSNATCNATAISTTTISTTARALVKDGSNTSILFLKRINLENTFQAGNTIIGRSSGAVATIASIGEDQTTIPIGLNANIAANVQIANNVATLLQVIDSGFGYLNRETVTLTKSDSTYSITAITSLEKQGQGQGFYTSTKGFLDNTKKIQDSDYYQSYSYEVQTKIPLSRYVDVLKKLMHVSGTKLFGRVVSTTHIDTETTVINSIEIN